MTTDNMMLVKGMVCTRILQALLQRIKTIVEERGAVTTDELMQGQQHTFDLMYKPLEATSETDPAHLQVRVDAALEDALEQLPLIWLKLGELASEAFLRGPHVAREFGLDPQGMPSLRVDCCSKRVKGGHHKSLPLRALTWFVGFLDAPDDFEDWGEGVTMIEVKQSVLLLGQVEISDGAGERFQAFA